MVVAGVEPRFESLDGLRVRYVRAGSGPTVVLIHGISSSIYSWKDVLPALARDHDVIALDLPGFGRSDQPANLNAAIYPRVVLGLMDRLGVARASLVGHSLGGAVAVLVSGEAPDRVERLALLDAAGFNLAPSQRPVLLRVAAAVPAPVLERLPTRPVLLRLGLRQVFFDPAHVTPERFNEYLAPLQRPGAMTAFRSLLVSGGFASAEDFARRAGQIHVPTLVVWGAEDRWVAPSDADRFAAAIPGARKVMFPECGHMPQEEKPAELITLLRDFL
jgi:pimeloyl-ACP methyl ester carboxylesterase